MKTWKESFWSLFHVLKEIMLLLESKEEALGRRKYDGYFESVRKRLDNIVNEIPREEL